MNVKLGFKFTVVWPLRVTCTLIPWPADIGCANRLIPALPVKVLQFPPEHSTTVAGAVKWT